MIKQPRYKTMKCNQTTKCPHYKGDGYRYCFDSIEFLFCDECNKKLLIQMLDQFNIEQSLKELGDK
jgi:hypothetical protein